MARKKGKPKQKKPRQQSSGQLKRHYRDKARRQKQARQSPPGVKERFLSGCMAFGLVGALFLIVAVTWTCVFAE